MVPDFSLEIVTFRRASTIKVQSTTTRPVVNRAANASAHGIANENC